MDSSEKAEQSVILSIPFDEMTVDATFTDANLKTWTAVYSDENENGLVDSGDWISLHSPDSTNLYFTCVEIHDGYVDMYTGDTPSMMSLPGFTLVMGMLSFVAALAIVRRKD